jgi:hypothetical protein
MQVIYETMSTEEILKIIVRDYADPSNYEPYEKDYGEGPLVMRSPWISRDKGAHARRAMEILKARGVM